MPLLSVSVFVPPMETGPVGVVSVNDDKVKSSSNVVVRLLTEPLLNITDCPAVGLLLVSQLAAALHALLVAPPVHAGGGNVAMKRH